MPKSWNRRHCIPIPTRILMWTLHGFNIHQYTLLETQMHIHSVMNFWVSTNALAFNIIVLKLDDCMVSFIHYKTADPHEHLLSIFESLVFSYQETSSQWFMGSSHFWSVTEVCYGILLFYFIYTVDDLTIIPKLCKLNFNDELPVLVWHQWRIALVNIFLSCSKLYQLEFVQMWDLICYQQKKFI